MQSVTLLPNMSGKIDFIGEGVKAVAYDICNTNKRSNTISIHTTNFVGRFWLQGSLKLQPKEDLDWFIIPLTEETPYIEFDDFKGDDFVNRNNIYCNINGSYMWLRGIMDRSSYIHIPDCRVIPYDTHKPINNHYHSHIITSHVNVDPYYSSQPSCFPKELGSDNDFTQLNYYPSKVNPEYDPEYYKRWNPSYHPAYIRQLISRKLGNIEKVMLCF